MNEKIQKTIEINLKGLNTGGSDMVTRTMQQKTGLCQSNLVTDKEIRIYFKSFKDKKQEETEQRKAVEEELLNQSNEANPYLRYQEPMQLNRKGHTAIFKSVTRRKRDMQLDGKNPGLDKVPPVAHYKPKY